MKIILANPRGFCAGVNMAIECLERALDFFGPPLYVYHEIVHNKFVVERLDVPDPDKVAYLTQTTLSVDDANVVIAALRKKFPRIANPPKDDICYATQNRQEAVRELAARAELVLVLGSQNSSNSRRLAEIAQSLGIPAYLIDGVSEIRDDWFGGVETVLITAGASAPE